MAIYNLTDVKKKVREIKKDGGHVTKISISYAEFGEGWDTYINVWFCDKWYNEDFETYTLGEEEKKPKAIARCKRAVDSLEMLTANVEYVGEEIA